MAKELSFEEFVKIEEGISLGQLQEIKFAFQVSPGDIYLQTLLIRDTE